MQRNNASAPFAIIMPAYNEEKTVGGLVRELIGLYGSPTIVIDDHSRDDTRAEALAAGAAVLPLPFRSGALCAIQTGLRYVLGLGLSRAVTFDADGQHRPRSVAALVDAMDRKGADLVVGVCPERGGLCKRLARSCFRGLTGIECADPTSGLKAYNQKAMRLLLSPPALLHDFQDIETLLLIRKAGLGMAQVRVEMNSRAHGRSRTFHSGPALAAYLARSLLIAAAKIRE